MSRRPFNHRKLPAGLVASYDSYTREYRVTWCTAEIVAAFVRLRIAIPPGAVKQRAEDMAYYTNDKDDLIAAAIQMDATCTLRGLVGEAAFLPLFEDGVANRILDDMADISEMARVNEALGGPLPVEAYP